MSIKIGLVGLPNAGKSTLFNSLTNLSVPAENYPFNTIEPNIGVAEVRDERVERISMLISPGKETYTQVQYFDIAGLVKGASKGEGLGNQFLANIREVDCIVLVLRGFVDSSVEHVSGVLDPVSDKETLLAELQLKDIETLEKKIALVEKSKSNDPQRKSLATYKSLASYLSKGGLVAEYMVDNGDLDHDILSDLASLQLLTAKPIVYLLNTTDYSQEPSELKSELSLKPEQVCLAFDVKLEAELLESGFEALAEFGIDQEAGIVRLSRACFYKLGYVVFITAGEKEVRSWAVKSGTNAKQAAGKIHADFAKKFIAAEVADYEDFVKYGSWEELRASGKVRQEGKDYIVKDGDVLIFKIGA